MSEIKYMVTPHPKMITTSYWFDPLEVVKEVWEVVLATKCLKYNNKLYKVIFSEFNMDNQKALIIVDRSSSSFF